MSTSSISLPLFSETAFLTCIANYVDTRLPPGISCCIPPISENFVRTSLQRLSTGKATGLDKLSGYFLKTAASYIFPPSSAIFNLSISSGIFPDFGKLPKSRHCIKMIRCLTNLIIAPYRFWLLYQKFLSVTYT